MTLEEWRAQIMLDLRDAGFEPKVYQGFPLVETPVTMEDKLRLLNVLKERRLTLSVQMTIYSEGALFTPYGCDPTQGKKREPEKQS